MKFLLLPFLSVICMLPLINPFDITNDAVTVDTCPLNNNAADIKFQEGSAEGKMACVAFKAQDYCRAELKDFDFDVHFFYCKRYRIFFRSKF